MGDADYLRESIASATSAVATAIAAVAAEHATRGQQQLDEAVSSAVSRATAEKEEAVAAADARHAAARARDKEEADAAVRAALVAAERAVAEKEEADIRAEKEKEEAVAAAEMRHAAVRAREKQEADAAVIAALMAVEKVVAEKEEAVAFADARHAAARMREKEEADTAVSAALMATEEAVAKAVARATELHQEPLPLVAICSRSLSLTQFDATQAALARAEEQRARAVEVLEQVQREVREQVSESQEREVQLKTKLAHAMESLLLKQREWEEDRIALERQVDNLKSDLAKRGGPYDAPSVADGLSGSTTLDGHFGATVSGHDDREDFLAIRFEEALSAKESPGRMSRRRSTQSVAAAPSNPALAASVAAPAAARGGLLGAPAAFSPEPTADSLLGGVIAAVQVPHAPAASTSPVAGGGVMTGVSGAPAAPASEPRGPSLSEVFAIPPIGTKALADTPATHTRLIRPSAVGTATVSPFGTIPATYLQTAARLLLARKGVVQQVDELLPRALQAVAARTVQTAARRMLARKELMHQVDELLLQALQAVAARTVQTAARRMLARKELMSRRKRIKDEDLMAKFMEATGHVAAMSLALNYPTDASYPHLMMNGIMNITAVAVARKELVRRREQAHNEEQLFTTVAQAEVDAAKSKEEKAQKEADMAAKLKQQQLEELEALRLDIEKRQVEREAEAKRRREELDLLEQEAKGLAAEEDKRLAEARNAEEAAAKSLQELRAVLEKQAATGEEAAKNALALALEEAKAQAAANAARDAADKAKAVVDRARREAHEARERLAVLEAEAAKAQAAEEAEAKAKAEEAKAAAQAAAQEAAAAEEANREAAAREAEAKRELERKAAETLAKAQSVAEEAAKAAKAARDAAALSAAAAKQAEEARDAARKQAEEKAEADRVARVAAAEAEEKEKKEKQAKAEKAAAAEKQALAAEQTRIRRQQTASDLESRLVSKLSFDLSWGFPDQGQDFLDATCLLFGQTSAGKWEKLDFVDYNHKKKPGIEHSGDKMGKDSDKGEGHGTHKMQLEMRALAGNVSHLFFVLSAWNADTIDQFKTPTLSLKNADNGKEITSYDSSKSVPRRALIISSAHKQPAGNWQVNGLSLPSDGNARDYTSIVKTCNEYLVKTYGEST